MSQLSFLTVEIAGQLVALNVAAVQAVLPMEKIVPVPLAPSTVVGVATKRGHVMTVIDARAAVTGDRALPATRESVVVNLNGHRYALLVDAIDEVISVAPEDIGLPPPGMNGVWSSIATGMIRLDGDRLALVIRLEHFVESAEIHAAEINHPITPAALEASAVS